LTGPVPDLLDTSPLAIVRRFEAAGFRAWPAASVHYDGTWVIRLTAGHTAKRLNSVNPLDPGDCRNLAERIARAARRFETYGRRLVLSGLKWAKLRGARVGWLQVEADNEVAVGLYRSLGFREAYRYHYRRPRG
jgi:GNAT superfamily N-acetyltransferase